MWVCDLYLAVYFFKWQMNNQLGASLDEPFDCLSLHQNNLYIVYRFSEFVVVNIKLVLSIVCPNFAWENIFWEYSQAAGLRFGCKLEVPHMKC